AQVVRRDSQGPAGIRCRLDRPRQLADGHPQNHHSQRPADDLHRRAHRRNRPRRSGLGAVPCPAQRTARGHDRPEHQLYGDLLMTTDIAAVPAQGFEAFTFGDPMPVLDGRELLDYLECWLNGRWYEPPLSLDGLAKLTRASVYLQSGLNFKRNMLERTFISHRLLSRQAFGQFALDWLWCGNAYLERRRNMLGQTLSLQPTLA